MMSFRLAYRGDAGQLARLHLLSSAKQPGGFMFQLGPTFLKRYYEILLDEGSSIILCAIGSTGQIVGFVSGSLEANSRIVALKKHRFSLLLALLPVFARDPRLVFKVVARQNSGTNNQPSFIYVADSGAHVDFWAWQQNSGGGAFPLFLKWLALMRLLGVKTVTGEVDRLNSSILKAHQILGAKVVEEFITPDNRIRLLIRYDLKS